MQIELDAVVSEYVLDTLESVSEGEAPPADRERAVTVALKALIETGMTHHTYNERRGIDEFRATKSLLALWERDFPELERLVDPTETIVVKVGKGRRSFSENLMITGAQRST